ncbi:Hypothetical predicted protein [Podarcis lilfordi]|uniref:Uncharacterized protein n=1 Tax=Podarcis lilfordi TaxID=74358 RepID=A0AA35JYR6_9SAUR|nr:Hypothetical predicted protein [Podarcis lilfordi]
MPNMAAAVLPRGGAAGGNLRPGPPPGNWSPLRIPSPSSPSPGGVQPGTAPGSLNPRSEPRWSLWLQPLTAKMVEPAANLSGSLGLLVAEKPEMPALYV